MKIFQIIGMDDRYFHHFENKYKPANIKTFATHNTTLIDDRLYGAHILLPVVNKETSAFYTIWDYPALQIKWAHEKGWNEVDLLKILYAQVEEFNPDVFYNCSPTSFETKDIKNLGQKGMIKIAWFAAPFKRNNDFSVYDTTLTNYPFYNSDKSNANERFDMFNPSFDPAMSRFNESTDRPNDIFFYGQYVPGSFDYRNKLIHQLIDLKKRKNWNIRVALLYSIQYKKPILNNIFTRRMMRYLKIIDSPPTVVRKSSCSPLFGVDLYREISRSKIVFNASVDFSGNYKFNMRNIESLGCGAHMISDDGIYPDGLEKERDFSVYQNFEDFVEKATYYLDHPGESRKIAQQGYKTISTVFSKEHQWDRFMEIVNSL
jgi:glycosyltransferase involved in cell wall biosynthesis